MYLFKFEPILKQTIWGGNKIITYKNLDSDLQQVGESWELSDVPGHESIVANGPLKGLSFPELISRFGASLVGRENLVRQISTACKVYRCPERFVHSGSSR